MRTKSRRYDQRGLPRGTLGGGYVLELNQLKRAPASSEHYDKDLRLWHFLGGLFRIEELPRLTYILLHHVKAQSVEPKISHQSVADLATSRRLA